MTLEPNVQKGDARRLPGRAYALGDGVAPRLGGVGGCPTVAGERRPDPPRQGRVGAARRSGDNGGGANVRQRRLVGEEAASGDVMTGIPYQRRPRPCG
jgi:hypothetical protein